MRKRGWQRKGMKRGLRTLLGPEGPVRLADAPDILTAEEVLAYLHISARRPAGALRNLERQGLRVLRVNRRLRVRSSELARFMGAVTDGASAWSDWMT